MGPRSSARPYYLGMDRHDDARERDLPARVRLPLADVEIDVLTEREAVARIVAGATSGEGGLVVTPNIDHLRQINRGSWLGSVYAEADLVVADGMPLIWASQLQRTPLPERVAGSHLLHSVAEAAGVAGLSIFLVGGKPGAAAETARRFQARWPDLEVAGVLCPPMGFERLRDGIAGIADAIAEASPDIVFTGLGAPKQNYLNVALRQRVPKAWYIGVGASFDMAAGMVQKAPPWAEKAGVEWVVRLVQEPRRMARRYLVEDLPFAARLLAAAALAGSRREVDR